MFSIVRGKGLQMTFRNGWTVSIQFGPGNYCEHHGAEWDAALKAGMKDGKWTSEQCEIAAWDANHVWHDFGSDTVQGHCTPDDVAAFIALIAAK